MFARIYAVLRGEPAVSQATAATPADLHVAVGALLVEAASRDDVFEPSERAAIERLLADRFELSPDSMAALLKASEEAKHGSLELFGFVRKLIKELDEHQRIEVIEMLWEVAYADSVLDAHEDAIIRKVAGLLYVSDFDRGAARRRARAKLGLGA
ncbi:MAG: TerB family tellurite resistance protein [Rhodospirillaceae bacterium]|nr:TerB family tellurite resistance protein [Rhodospirillaceae bacterium]